MSILINKNEGLEVHPDDSSLKRNWGGHKGKGEIRWSVLSIMGVKGGRAQGKNSSSNP